MRDGAALKQICRFRAVLVSILVIMLTASAAFCLRDFVYAEEIDLDIDNISPVYDAANAASMGIFLCAADNRPVEERLEYKMRFNGNCKINNRFFAPDTNTAGVCVNTFFSVGFDTDRPTLRIPVMRSGRLIMRQFRIPWHMIQSMCRS